MKLMSKVVAKKSEHAKTCYLRFVPTPISKNN